jgi:K+-transporting ATPase ATPase C chain
MSLQQVQDFLTKTIETRSFGILGEPIVNVLVLNLALDEFQGIKSDPAPAQEKK